VVIEDPVDPVVGVVFAPDIGSVGMFTSGPGVRAKVLSSFSETFVVAAKAFIEIGFCIDFVLLNNRCSAQLPSISGIWNTSHPPFAPDVIPNDSSIPTSIHNIGQEGAERIVVP
jgi:hypothetical protein